MDAFGLYIAAHAGAPMAEHFVQRCATPAFLSRMIDAGRGARKAGRGFNRYGYAGMKVPKGAEGVDGTVYALLGWVEKPVPAEEIAERCWLQMLNETARSIENGVIENPTDIDIGVVFGFGFPPFRGGLLREADRRGLPWVVDRLDHYAERHGERLRPTALLREMAAAGKTFHAD